MTRLPLAGGELVSRAAADNSTAETRKPRIPAKIITFIISFRFLRKEGSSIVDNFAPVTRKITMRRHATSSHWGLERFIVAHNAAYLPAVKRNLAMNADRRASQF